MEFDFLNNLILTKYFIAIYLKKNCLI